MHDLIVIGAGPAGISVALNAEELGLDYLVLEKSRILDTLHKFTMDKDVMDYPKEIPSLGPANFHEETARQLISEWTEKAGKCEIALEEVVDVRFVKDHYVVKTRVGEHKTRNVVIAIGLQGRPMTLGIPGEEQSNVFHNLLPKMDMEGKSVIVVGGGDTALEAAMIAQKGGADVVLSYRKPELTKPKKENIDALYKTKVKVVLNSNVTSIEGSKAKLSVGGKEQELQADYLLVCAGTQTSADFLSRIGVTVKRAPDFTQEPVEARPGLFVIGDLIGRPAIKMAVNQGSRVAKLIAERKG